MVEDKKPVVRHINQEMKKMLKRMQKIEEQVSAHLEASPKDTQHTKGCSNCDATQRKDAKREDLVTTLPGKVSTKSMPLRNIERPASQLCEQNIINDCPRDIAVAIPCPQQPEKSKWQKVGKRTKKNPIYNCRPDAVMIQCKEKEAYAQVLKAVQNDGTIQEFKHNVAGIRRTAAGELLLRMTKASDECTGKLQKAIQNIIGEQAVVKAIADKVTLEIRDIAEWTTSDEVLEAVFRAIDCDLSAEAAPKLRPAYQGTQTATLILPKDIAEQILKLNKIRIGWSICRLRAKVEPRRCYRCLSFGHIASRCRSKHDATKLCFNCGGENHASKDCKLTAVCILCKRSGEQNTAHSTLSKLCPRYIEAVRTHTN